MNRHVHAIALAVVFLRDEAEVAFSVSAVLIYGIQGKLEITSTQAFGNVQLYHVVDTITVNSIGELNKH